MTIEGNVGTAIVPVHPAPAMAVQDLLNAQPGVYALAARLIEAGQIMLPKALDTPEKVGAVMMCGLEMGLTPMSAIRHLYIIDDRVVNSAQLNAGLVLRDPTARYIVHERTDDAADVELVRQGKTAARIRYTMTDAQNAGITKDRQGGVKRNWRLFPADMLC